MAACSDTDVPAVDEFLLRVGDRTVSGQEFEQLMELSKIAYPPAANSNPEILEVIRHRLLVEMIEELLIFERADELGISVSEEELERHVSDIRKDYPQGAFEQIFIEQAVPYELWKKRTGDRLLLDKVLAADLADRPPATAPDGSLPGSRMTVEQLKGSSVSDHPGKEISAVSDNRYEDWIRQLAARLPVEINTALWRKRYGP